MIVTKKRGVHVEPSLTARLEGLDLVPSARLRIGYPRWLSPFLQRGVIAITLGRRVYLSEGLLQRSEDELLRIVRHELAHVGQVRRLGLVRFLYRYAREYVTARRRGVASYAAYEQISFEQEARAAEEIDGTPGVR